MTKTLATTPSIDGEPESAIPAMNMIQGDGCNPMRVMKIGDGI